MTIREQLKNIRETYGNREILEIYEETIFDTITDKYRGLSIYVANSNKEFGLDWPDKHIEIDVIPENNERMKYCRTPIKIYMSREGTRKSDNVKLRIVCSETDTTTGSSSFDVTESLPVSDEIIKGPKLLINYLTDFFQMLDFYILGKPVSYSHDTDE